MLYPVLTVLTNNLLRAARYNKVKNNCFVGAHWVRDYNFKNYKDDEGAKGVSVSFKMPKNGNGRPDDTLVVQLRNVVYGTNCNDIEFSITTKKLDTTTNTYDHMDEACSRRILYNVSDMSLADIERNFVNVYNLHRNKVGDMALPVDALLDDMFSKFTVTAVA